MTYTIRLTKGQNNVADAQWQKHGVSLGSMFAQVFPFRYYRGELTVGIYTPQETRAINATLKKLIAKRKARVAKANKPSQKTL